RLHGVSGRSAAKDGVRDVAAGTGETDAAAETDRKLAVLVGEGALATIGAPEEPGQELTAEEGVVLGLIFLGGDFRLRHRRPLLLRCWQRGRAFREIQRPARAWVEGPRGAPGRRRGRDRAAPARARTSARRDPPPRRSRAWRATRGGRGWCRSARRDRSPASSAGSASGGTS